MAMPYAIIIPILAATVAAHPMDGTAMISPEMSISVCMPGSTVTAMPHCGAWVQSAQNICPNKPTRDERIHCLCSSEFLDTLQGCQAELAACFQNEVNDDLEPAFSAWHDGCDKYTTIPSSPVTAPPATTTTTTSYFYDEDFCVSRGKQACESAHIEFNQCTTLKTDQAQYSSCVCDPRILSNAYTCEIIVATRCLGTTAAVSDMPLSVACGNFASVIGTGLPDADKTTIYLSTTTTPASEPATPIRTTPILPVSTTPLIPGNAAGRLAWHGGRATLAMVGFVAFWVVF